MASCRRSAQRGFTLVELMAVVAIMGMLATLAFVGFTRHLRASRTAEALAVIQSIRAAQERYRAENQQYFDVSTGADKWFPTPGEGNVPGPFIPASHTDLANWKVLQPTVTRPVLFGYLVDAGLPGELPTNGANLVTARKFTAGFTATEPWYVVQARVDTDENGVFCAVVASSFSPEVFVEEEGE